MIFGQPGIKKHRVIIDIKNNFLAFLPGYCLYIGAISLLTLSSLLKKIAAIIIKEDITSQKIIKRGLNKDMIDFL